jgi:hypothetical protein
VSTLRELHEAATGAPWTTSDGAGRVWIEGERLPPGVQLNDYLCDHMTPKNAALIVALRNAYADGTLVERENREDCARCIAADADELALLRLRNSELERMVDAGRWPPAPPLRNGGKCMPSVPGLASIPPQGDYDWRVDIVHVPAFRRNRLAAHIEQVTRERDAAYAAIRWALGEGDSDFGDDLPDNAPPYWWRKPLREKAGLVWSAGRCRSVRADELLGGDEGMSDITERQARFVYDGARLAAEAAGAPIIPVPWAEREEAFRSQFREVIERQMGDKRSRSPEELHGSWMQAYYAMGWEHGDVYDREAKVHPDLVPYADLGQLERDKDAVFIALCEIARQWVYEGGEDR